MKNLLQLVTFFFLTASMSVRAEFSSLQQAQQLMNQGQIEKAVRILDTALHNADSREEKALILGTLGNAYTLNGENEKAIAFYQDALAVSLDRPTQIKTYNNLVDVRLKLIRSYQELEAYALREEKLADAEQWQQKQVQLQQQAEKENETALFLSEETNLKFSVLLRAIELGKKEQIAQAMLLMASLSKQSESVNKLLRLATLANRQDQFKILKIAISISRSLNNSRLLAFTQLKEAKAYYREQQYDRSFEKAVETALTVGSLHPDLLYQSYSLQGKIYEQLQQEQQAMAMYQKAYQTLSTIRYALFRSKGNSQFDYETQVEPVFRDYLELLLAQASPDLEQIINILESFQIAELNNYFKDYCVFENHRDAKQILEKTQSTAIYSFIGQKNTYFITVNPQGKKELAKIPIDSDKLNLMLQSWRATLENPFDPSYLSKGKKLYDILWRSSLKTQIQTEKIIFIPDGYLRNVPIAALFDGRDFLLAHHTISYSLRLTRPNRTSNIPQEAWLLGAKNGNNGTENIQKELKLVREAIRLPTQQRLNFDQQDLARAIASPSSLVHLATHGYFGGTLEQSWIESGKGKITLAQFDTLLQQTSNKVALLFFSACETAQGNSQSFLGLAGLGFRSPIEASIGTLWSVNEASTIELVSYFYRSSSFPRAQGLKESQVEFNQNIDYHYTHPYYWAAFIYVE